MIKTTLQKAKAISNSKPNKVRFKFLKDRVIAESEKSILVNLTSEVKYSNVMAAWVPKLGTYVADYGNYLTGDYPTTHTFSVINSDTSKEISVEELKKLISIDNI